MPHLIKPYEECSGDVLRLCPTCKAEHDEAIKAALKRGPRPTIGRLSLSA